MASFDITTPVHRLWTTTHEPVVEVGDGDTIDFWSQEAGGGQFDKVRNGDPIPEFDWDVIYPLVGPVLVHGAEPGDVLEIEFLEFSSDPWGWTAILPGLGLLPEDFPDAHFHRWELSTPGGAKFKDVATVPLRPFCGVVGVCPDTAEPQQVLPPGHFGGNMDCRDLVAGSRLFLPVQVPGARLSLGDPHAAQGDGEVCVSAIEASLHGSVRIRLHKNRTIAAPQFQTAGPLRGGIDDAGYYATMGIAPDLMTAARDALRSMIDHMSTTYGLDPRDAYVLSSACVDLKITELVDQPNWIVSAYLPISVFNT